MPVRKFSKWATALVMAGFLAACEAAPDETAELAITVPDPVPETTADGGDAGSDPAQGLLIETGATVPEVVALPEVAALPPEPAIDDDPQQLYGLDSAALDKLLGQPSLIRTEDPAEIWQYRSQTCVFDIFLYEEAGQARVTYIEARDGAAAQIEARYCLNELLRARMDPPLG